MTAWAQVRAVEQWAARRYFGMSASEWASLTRDQQVTLLAALGEES